MQKHIRPMAAVAIAAVLAGGTLSACSATPGGTSTSSGSKNIASLVTANAKTPLDTLLTSLGPPKAGKDVTLCYVTRTLSNEFWSYEVQGFKARAAQLGVKAKVFAVTDESSITEQLDAAQSAAKQGCSAILASPIAADSLDSVFGPEIAKGVPAVVLNDAKGTLPGVVYVGPDASDLGKLAADYIAQKLPSGGNVAMIGGDPGSSNAVQRGKGFTAALKSHPDLKLVASQSITNWDVTQAQQAAATMLTAHPDIKAFYSQNDDMGLGVQTAIANAGLTGKVVLIGSDGIPEAKKQIAAGKYTATCSERPVTEGGAGVDAALWLLAGKTVPAWVNVPGFIIDSSNVAKYPTGMP
ncbi:substrate-binding domain-containing protein [Arthrobacter dokdonensis]|uniref:substrate-binding domain-containing protein n=1 Tax=Arthrobacter dokdonellae TaxID=2211210 RepID=UPI000DE5A057|nr:substrate-binding domain-containing protein [Arthrobacter dokdonellae]